MSRTFAMVLDPYYTGEKIFTKKEFIFNPGVTVLVGCNGTGKTTLLHHIKEALRKECVPCMDYNNLSNGGSSATSAAMFHNDIELAAALMTSSEGEQIYINLGTAAQKIGGFVRNNKGAKELWLLFDAIDSGLSVDNILEVKEYLFQTIIDDNPNSDVYIIVSANEYEMCRGENCFDVRTGKYVAFKTYEAYRKFIIKSREKKDARIAAAEKKRGRKNGKN